MAKTKKTNIIPKSKKVKKFSEKQGKNMIGSNIEKLNLYEKKENSFKHLKNNKSTIKINHESQKPSKNNSKKPIDINKKSKKEKMLKKKLQSKREKNVEKSTKSKSNGSILNEELKSQGVFSNPREALVTVGVETAGNECCNMMSSLPGVGFTWGATLDDLNLLRPNVYEDSENDEDEIEIKKAKHKMTKAERVAAAKAEEAKVRAAEDELLERGDPVSPDSFDRMLLAQPDSSELWVKYMAYHLQGTEIEKARAVARRGLTVINIRCEEERLNVWTALLNLEHLYGTRESLQTCLHEAVRCNDELKVYLNLMNIYAASGQTRELDSTVKLLLKKAGTGHSSVNIYLQCANTLLQQGQQDTARHILQRGLNNLPPAVHVTLISRFALAENKYGDSTRAQALLEHTLTSYPARTDVWGVYVDMLAKSGRVDLARQVIQRAVSQKLPPKKLKPLYMKWLKLEEQYGDAEAVENVKKEIEQYVKDTRGKLNNVKLAL